MSSDSFTPRHAWLPRWMTSEHPLPWLLPAGALMVVFGIFPLYKAIETSLYKRNAATRKMIFDPTHNWTKVFLDERVWNALLNTLFYTGAALALAAAGLLYSWFSPGSNEENPRHQR